MFNANINMLGNRRNIKMSYAIIQRSYSDEPMFSNDGSFTEWVICYAKTQKKAKYFIENNPNRILRIEISNKKNNDDDYIDLLIKNTELENKIRKLEHDALTDKWNIKELTEGLRFYCHTSSDINWKAMQILKECGIDWRLS